MTARTHLIACHLRAGLIASFRDYAVDGATVHSFGPVSVDVNSLAERIDAALADGEAEHDEARAIVRAQLEASVEALTP